MLVAMLIYIAFIFLLIAAAVLILRGKAVWLISGYHSMPSEEKEQYDIRALCRFVAIVLFVFAGSVLFIMLGDLLLLPPFSWVGAAAGSAAAIFAIIYTNTSNHFRKG